jgi:hypothetical protein
LWQPLCNTKNISISVIMLSDIQCTPVFVEGVCTCGYRHPPFTSSIQPAPMLNPLWHFGIPISASTANL